MEAWLTWLIRCSFKIPLNTVSRPEITLTQKRPLIPPQSRTVAPRTSMLSPRRTAPSTSASPPQKNSPLKFVTHVKTRLYNPFSASVCKITSSKVGVFGGKPVNSVIPHHSSFSTPLDFKTNPCRINYRSQVLRPFREDEPFRPITRRIPLITRKRAGFIHPTLSMRESILGSARVGLRVQPKTGWALLLHTQWRLICFPVLTV